MAQEWLFIHDECGNRRGAFSTLAAAAGVKESAA